MAKKRNNYNIADNLYKDYFCKGVKTTKNNRKGGQYSKFEENDIERFAFNQAIENYEPTNRCVNIDLEGLDTLSEDVLNKYEDLIYIPERPIGAEAMSTEELMTAESESYYKWRRDMLEIQKKVQLTPFELNLEFWRQLWRVIEKSDILTQIVDARNPLLYRCKALERYVKKIDENKSCVLLINKSDHLTEKQRKSWAEYFDTEEIQVYFWSAKDAEDNNEKSKTKLDDIKEKNEHNKSEDESFENTDDGLNESISVEDTDDDLNESISVENSEDESEEVSEDKSLEGVNKKANEYTDDIKVKTIVDSTINREYADESITADGKIHNSSDILDKDTLMRLLEKIPVPNKDNRLEKKSVIGLIGYPNVGKSSTINSMYGRKKASVSATPGRTKTFQTLHISENLLFCDCPGLIFPSVVNNSAELMLAGIIPIDKSKNLLPAANLIVNQFPKESLEGIYNIELTKLDGMNTPLTGRDFLSALAYGRGLVGKNKCPFVQQAGRIALKDYTSGKLLYRYPPPRYTADQFESPAPLSEKNLAKLQKRLDQIKEVDPILEQIQKLDFGKKCILGPNAVIKENVSKSRRKNKKPCREKARKVYKHLNP